MRNKGLNVFINLFLAFQQVVIKGEDAFMNIQERLHQNLGNLNMAELEKNLGSTQRKAKEAYASILYEKAKVRWIDFGDEKKISIRIEIHIQ